MLPLTGGGGKILDLVSECGSGYCPMPGCSGQGKELRRSIKVKIHFIRHATVGITNKIYINIDNHNPLTCK